MPNAESESNGIQLLTKGLDDITAALSAAKTATDDKYREIANRFDGLKVESAEVKADVKKAVDEYAALTIKVQALTEQQADTKRQLDAPMFQNQKDLDDHDRKMAMQIQKEMHLARGLPESEFVLDADNLVDIKSYREVVKLLTRVGVESKAKIVGGFNVAQKKAFEASTLGPSFFTPQILALDVDCNIECEAMTDLYGQFTVDRSNFMYMQIKDYGALGQYTCDAVCDAPFGPEGNVQHLAGQTYDFRGVFCLQRKHITEANFDFLSFMVISAQRSHRINRNRALMIGDGINEPEGWMTANCFPKMKTELAGEGDGEYPLFTPQDFRRFVLTFPVERGRGRAVMHQNMFAWLASQVDANGRFVFGDGDMLFSPDRVTDLIRLSNCLPDATEDNTKGGPGNGFDPGSFLMAYGNWATAYYNVNKRPLFFEQYEGGSSAWCVKYQFGAEDGGFVGCCESARVLVAG